MLYVCMCGPYVLHTVLYRMAGTLNSFITSCSPTSRGLFGGNEKKIISSFLVLRKRDFSGNKDILVFSKTLIELTKKNSFLMKFYTTNVMKPET